MPGVGSSVQTSHGPLFLHEKAASLFLQTCFESERKLSAPSLKTLFQNLKKGLRENLPEALQPAWAAYKTPLPSSVVELLKELEKGQARLSVHPWKSKGGAVRDPTLEGM